jgi:hypothetical protein
MEILVNELSLTGQFSDIPCFIDGALLQFVAVLNEFDSNKDGLYKKLDFYASPVTCDVSVHDILVGKYSRQYDAIRKFKRQLNSLFNDPYWEKSRRHSADCAYFYNGSNVCNQSLSEACERDRAVVSFIHDDFSDTQLTVLKNQQKIIVDNLFDRGHYIELAHQRGTLSYSDYFKRKFTAGQLSLLDNAERFRKLGLSRQGQPVFEETTTGHFWYLDNLHKNHYEVFNANEEHIGVADINGEVDASKRIKGRRL